MVRIKRNKAKEVRECIFK